MADHDELLDLALRSAREAGELLLEGSRRTLRVESKSTPTDVVTEMDRAGEALLVERLLGARPDDGVLGEEGASIEGTSGVRWVLDPIDGTVNYLYGIPAWAVSVAAEVDGRAVAGVVHVPAMRETFVATLGGGARLITPDGETALAVRECPTLAGALIGTGFGYHEDRRRAQAAVLSTLITRIRDIRRVGACSVDLCWLAAGRVDGYYERGVNAWDHAAGGLVAREAGGRVEGVGGAPVDPRLLISAVPTIFDELHDLLVSLGAHSGD